MGQRRDLYEAILGGGDTTMKETCALLVLPLKLPSWLRRFNKRQLVQQQPRKLGPGLARTSISCTVPPWTFSCSVLGNMDKSWMMFQNGWCWLGPSDHSSPIPNPGQTGSKNRSWFCHPPGQQVGILHSQVGQFSTRAGILEGLTITANSSSPFQF